MKPNQQESVCVVDHNDYNKNNDMPLDNQQFGSWEETIPNYGQRPILSNTLRMMISIGSSVLIKKEGRNGVDEQNDDDVIVATIVSYQSETEVTCLMYKSIDELDCRSMISRMSIGVGYGLREVLKTKQKIVVSIDEVIDFAFIFQIRNLEDDCINYGGISNCYLLRFQAEDGIINDVEHHQRFPCDSPQHRMHQSTMATIWHGISCLQDSLWKVLNSAAERQVPIVRVPVNIDCTLMQYIEYRSDVVVAAVTLKQSGRLSFTTLKGMKRSTKKAKRKLKLRRFETVEQLGILRKIIGDSCTIGIRRRRPKLGFTDRLQMNNGINIIVGSENEPTTKKQVYHESIDFVSDERETYMMVRYVSYLYNSKGITNEFRNVTSNDYVAYMLSSIDPMVNAIKYKDNVRVGQIFGRGENAVLQVKSIDENVAVLTYLQPEEYVGKEIYETNFEGLRNEIRQYNSID